MTIGEAFDHTVKRCPDREALVERSQGCACGSMSLGVRKGGRVGVWAPNRSEWTITQFATATVGAILYGHPKISDAQVVGAPDTRYGEALIAWGILRDRQCATPEEMSAHPRGQCATTKMPPRCHQDATKMPRCWQCVDRFALAVTGKARTYLMRQAAIDELGLEAAASVHTA
jgi:acyl-CoA synthetase (AMP-forming)/AMP-acid ligase II